MLKVDSKLCCAKISVSCHHASLRFFKTYHSLKIFFPNCTSNSFSIFICCFPTKKVNKDQSNLAKGNIARLIMSYAKEIHSPGGNTLRVVGIAAAPILREALKRVSWGQRWYSYHSKERWRFLISSLL